MAYNIIGIPNRDETVPIDSYSPESEFDKIDKAYTDVEPNNPDATWINEPFPEGVKASTHEYIDSLRPGGHNYSKLTNDIADTLSRIDDHAALIVRGPSVLFNPGIAKSYGLTKTDPSERHQQLIRKHGNLKGDLTQLTKQLQEMSDTVSQHDSGQPEPDTRDYTAPQLLKTEATNAIIKRLASGDVPIDEFKTNPDLTQTYRGETNYIGAPKLIAGNHENLKRSFDKLVDLAHKGVRSKFWYDAASNIIKHITRGNLDDADKLAQVMAITSANTGLDTNVNKAIKAYTIYREAVATGKYIPLDSVGMTEAQTRDAESTLYGNRRTWEGRKVSNFYQNLAKRLGQPVGGSTVDVHMKDAMGYNDLPDGTKLDKKHRTAVTEKEYNFTHNMLAQVAEHLSNEDGVSWTPDQAQAAIWTAVRSQMLNGKDEDLDDAIERHSKVASSNKNPSGMEADLKGHPDIVGDNLLRVETEKFEGLDNLKRLVNNAVTNGKITQDQAEEYGKFLKGDGQINDDPLNLKYTYAIMQSKYNKDINDIMSANRASLGNDLKLKLKVAQAHNQILRANQSKIDPYMYDIFDSANRMLPGQVNLELTPSSKAYPELDGFNEEAPFNIRAMLTNRLAHIPQIMASRLGIPRSANGDVIGFSDTRGKINPLIGLGVNAPNISYDTPQTLPEAENQARLLAATLGLAFRKRGVSYMALHPVKGGIDNLKSSNAAFFKTTEGAMNISDWHNLLEARHIICSTEGVDPDMIRLSPAVAHGGLGFVMCNSDNDLSNKSFHQLAARIVNESKLRNHGLKFDHILLTNNGGTINEPWTDTGDNGEQRIPGDNYRAEIKRLRGGATSDYADQLYESKVKPILESFHNWRDIIDGPEPSEFSTSRRVFASEALSGRHRETDQQLGRTADQETPRRVRLSELVAYANAVKAGSSLKSFDSVIEQAAMLALAIVQAESSRRC